MNLTKLITTILTVSLTLSAGTVLSQEKQKTMKGNLEPAEQNLKGRLVNNGFKDPDKAAEKNLEPAEQNLKGRLVNNGFENPGKAAEEGLANTAEAAEQGLEDTVEAAEEGLANAAETIQTKSNWGWLGLIGLLGLFGLLGKNKKTTVIEEDNNVEYLQS